MQASIKRGLKGQEEEHVRVEERGCEGSETLGADLIGFAPVSRWREYN
jgi:hypothetical protein